MISLNITSITDEIFALTALRNAVVGGSEETVATPAILTRDNLPALRVLVRSAFAAIVGQLLSYICESSLDDGNPVADAPYNPDQPVNLCLDFGIYTDSLSAGALMVLKRYLEHLIALTVLQRIYLPLDSAIAATHASEAASLITAIRNLLDIPASPLTLSPAYL